MTSVEVAARTEYHKLEERLRARGLRQVVGPGEPICRWTYEDVVIDVMPTAEGVLSFSNRWYAEGLKNAAGRTLPGHVPGTGRAARVRDRLEAASAETSS